MKRITGLFFCLSLMSGLLLSCKEEIPSVYAINEQIPDAVSNVRVENRPGGAKLMYEVPRSANLLYVKAVYEFPAGNIREVKSSMYVDTLLIEGIGDEGERQVQVFAVSRSEKVSEPVTLNISPKTPPAKLVAPTLMLKEGFGGISVQFANTLRADIVITVMRETGLGWETVDALYTNSATGTFHARGLKSESTNFGVFVRDRWYNRSDTIKQELTPLFEERIPSPKPITHLPGDYNVHWAGLDYTYMFNGVFTDYMGTFGTETSNLPLSFTLDFQSPTQFSRLKYWMRHEEDMLYNYCSPEEFELWGSNELDDNWDKWTKIMDCMVEKPSGLPLGDVSNADREAASAGLDFEFPEGTPSFRYIRWKTNRVFGGLPAVQIAELRFWGSQK